MTGPGADKSAKTIHITVRQEDAQELARAGAACAAAESETGGERRRGDERKTANAELRRSRQNRRDALTGTAEEATPCCRHGRGGEEEGELSRTQL
eukprot:596322-Hanusia_phi.AAC.1